MSETAQEFDVLILGGGSAGYGAALRAVQHGLTVGLIEKSKLGGTCLHWGCIPTKAYLHAAEVADEARHASSFGVNATVESVDMGKVRDYKDGIVAGKFKGLSGLLKMRKVNVIEGEGKLVSQNEIEVDGTRYQGKHIILASGSYSKTFGLTVSDRIMTSTEALQLDYLPKSAIVLGGGVIGSEFASLWNSFGVDVTIIEGLDHLVPNEDPSIIKILEREFKKKKIKSNLGTFFDKVEETDSGVKVTLADGKEFEAEVCLVAVGRGPNTEGLGFEEQGITLDRGFVITDERLHTGVGNIYAIGDIVPGVQLAHRGYQQGIFVAEEIAGNNPLIVEDVNIPKVTFTEPEIMSVGYSQPKAEEKFGKENIEVTEYNLAGNGKSSILGTGGVIKMVRQKDGAIIGVHGIGKRISEQIGEAQLIVNWEAYPEDVAAFIHAHPTQNESLGEAAMALNGHPLHG
ncbi:MULTISPECIES: dihydrolipoyl dehydrogenase [Citricoccus]|uniref:Dihydrolipoyl dehydrogenase n=1 Tax=Citricoccus muralis TaxID=169134 RepID=A0ABY8H494_9MICC|nr:MULTISPECIES: dihydrolipoyl dehydrogenase [Citricoccus]WBL18141.1 dihydrolipoyl dehydrogenase [Citricoccus sp. NR2]WFP15477.1 dihydrolipoyl dehydrogenase [Citricoccus muralis]